MREWSYEIFPYKTKDFKLGPDYNHSHSNIHNSI